MKAVIINEFGTSDVLKYVECPKPTISAGEILIRTTYTSVNFADIKNRTGNKAKANFPMILGLDVAGIVEEVLMGTVILKGETKLLHFRKMEHMQNMWWRMSS